MRPPQQPSAMNIPVGQRPTSQVDPNNLRYYDGGPTDAGEWLESFRQSYQRPRRMKDMLVGLLLRTVCRVSGDGSTKST
jgi:hypothetical protein